MHIKIKTTNLRGLPVGSSHHWCAWPDAMVERARALGAAGMHARAIAAELQGPHFVTVYRWLAGQRRRPHVRVFARRIKEHPHADLA